MDFLAQRVFAPDNYWNSCGLIHSHVCIFKHRWVYPHCLDPTRLQGERPLGVLEPSVFGLRPFEYWHWSTSPTPESLHLTVFKSILSSNQRGAGPTGPSLGASCSSSSLPSSATVGQLEQISLHIALTHAVGCRHVGSTLVVELCRFPPHNSWDELVVSSEIWRRSHRTHTKPLPVVRSAHTPPPHDGVTICTVHRLYIPVYTQV